MINHARTLLLNVTGPRNPSAAIPGDEYIPAFMSADLSDRLRTVYDVLFGGNPDYSGRVYRVTEFMKIIHASGYDSYVYDLGPRITYDTGGVTTPVAAVANFKNGYYTSSVTGGREFGVTGTWTAAGYDGRVNHSWLITAITSDTLSIENLRTHVSYVTELNAVKILPGSDLRLTTTVTALTPGQQWTAAYSARPKPSLGVILASLKALPQPVIGTVFGAGARQEPFLTFYNLFTQHAYMPQQLAGFLLALIYRLDAERQANG